MGDEGVATGAPAVLSREHHDRVAVLRLSRPAKRNALSHELRVAVVDALAELAVDDSIHTVALLGDGPTFCAGFDLNEFDVTDLERKRCFAKSGTAFQRAVLTFSKPIVAGIQGFCLAGGLDLALMSDVRIAATGATFGHPEIKHGVAPMFSFLSGVVGDATARYLCLTGRRLTADEALRLGLVQAVVPNGDLRQETLRTAAGIAEAPLAALQAVKRFAHETNGQARLAAFGREDGEFVAQYLSPAGVKPAGQGSG